MAQDPFDRCWDRIERAQTHDHAAVDEWNDYVNRDPYDARLIVDHDGRCTLWIEEIEPVPSLISVLLGKRAYNLRAALYYCAYAVAICDSRQDPPPREDGIQFPIY
jgi:hypothetical protein